MLQPLAAGAHVVVGTSGLTDDDYEETAFEVHTDIPCWIMQGYMTMSMEANGQMTKAASTISGILVFWAAEVIEERKK